MKLLALLVTVGALGCGHGPYYAVIVGDYDYPTPPNLYFYRDGARMPDCYVGKGLNKTWYASHNLWTTSVTSETYPTWADAVHAAERWCKP